MKKVVLLLLCAIIASLFGCTDGALSHGVSSPSITVNSQGEIYALYQVYHGFEYEYYLQKFGLDGSKLWGEKGIKVGSEPGESTNNGQNIITDEDSLITICASQICSISSAGEILWSKTFDDIRQHYDAVSDNAGGIMYLTSSLGLKRIDSEGNIVWDIQDFPQISSSSIVKITGDGFGGILSAVVDGDTLKVRRLDSGGEHIWAYEVTRSCPDCKEAEVFVKSDSKGGAFIVLVELAPDDAKTYRDQVSILRLDQDGENLWQRDVTQSPVNFEFIVTDDYDSAFLCWSKYSNLYINKISSEGTMLWPEAKTFTFDGNVYHGCIADNNGVILGWNFWDQQGRFLCGQIIDENGNLTLPGKEGVKLSENSMVHSSNLPVTTFRILSDKEGGALFSWGSSEVLYSIEHSWVQRVDDKGEIMWGDYGVQLDDWN